jgi:hypothetical protein
MDTLAYVRAEDQLQDGATAPGGALDLTPLAGTWHNTETDTAGVLKLVLSPFDGLFLVKAIGASSPSPYDWGEVPATVYGESVAATEAMGFSAVYDFGFLTTILAGHVRQGILVLCTFNSFKDLSGRSNYFTRELFHR